MKKQSKKTLKRNDKDWAIVSIIEHAKIQSSTVFAWNFITGKKVTVEVSFHILKKYKNEMIIRVMKESDKRKLGNLVVAAQNLNFYLPDELVLFQTSVKELLNNGDVRVTIPEMVAQIDRRDSYRLLLESKNVSSHLNFTKKSHVIKRHEQKFEKNVFDLSSGGISFLISRMEKDFFKIGDFVESIELKFEKSDLNISGQIVNIFEIQPSSTYNMNYKVWKVSIHILELNEESKKLIDDFVFRYGDLEEAI